MIIHSYFYSRPRGGRLYHVFESRLDLAPLCGFTPKGGHVRSSPPENLTAYTLRGRDGFMKLLCPRCRSKAEQREQAHDQA